MVQMLLSTLALLAPGVAGINVNADQNGGSVAPDQVKAEETPAPAVAEGGERVGEEGASPRAEDAEGDAVDGEGKEPEDNVFRGTDQWVVYQIQPPQWDAGQGTELYEIKDTSRDEPITEEDRLYTRYNNMYTFYQKVLEHKPEFAQIMLQEPPTPFPPCEGIVGWGAKKLLFGYGLLDYDRNERAKQMNAWLGRVQAAGYLIEYQTGDPEWRLHMNEAWDSVVVEDPLSAVEDGSATTGSLGDGSDVASASSTAAETVAQDGGDGETTEEPVVAAASKDEAEANGDGEQESSGQPGPTNSEEAEYNAAAASAGPTTNDAGPPTVPEEQESRGFFGGLFSRGSRRAIDATPAAEIAEQKEAETGSGSPGDEGAEDARKKRSHNLPTEWHEEIITKTIVKDPDAERMIGIRIHSPSIIGSVYAKTPCAKAELMKGMKVLSVDGRAVSGKEQVAKYIYEAGNSFTMDVQMYKNWTPPKRTSRSSRSRSKAKEGEGSGDDKQKKK